MHAPKKKDEEQRGNALTHAWLAFLNNSKPYDFSERKGSASTHTSTNPRA